MFYVLFLALVVAFVKPSMAQTGDVLAVLTASTGTQMYSEGIAYNNDKLYLSSLAGPQIFEFNTAKVQDGNTETYNLEHTHTYRIPDEQKRSCGGLDYDPKEKILWCAMSSLSHTTLTATNGALAGMKIKRNGCGTNTSPTLELKHLINFKKQNGTIGSANDVARGVNGYVYVTDWRLGIVYSFHPTTPNELHIVSNHPSLHPVEFSGANGVVANEKYVITTALDRKKLVRIDASGTTKDIDLEEDVGGDGLLLLPDRHLVVVLPDEVILFQLDEEWGKATKIASVEVNTLDGMRLTTAALAEEHNNSYIIYVTGLRVHDFVGPNAAGLNDDPALIYRIRFSL